MERHTVRNVGWGEVFDNVVWDKCQAVRGWSVYVVPLNWSHLGCEP
jgi:hypothetical protein